MILNILTLIVVSVLAIMLSIKDRQYTTLLQTLNGKIDKVGSNNLEYFNEVSKNLSSITYFSRSIYYKYYPKNNTNHSKNIKRV